MPRDHEIGSIGLSGRCARKRVINSDQIGRCEKRGRPVWGKGALELIRPCGGRTAKQRRPTWHIPGYPGDAGKVMKPSWRFGKADCTKKVPPSSTDRNQVRRTKLLGHASTPPRKCGSLATKLPEGGFIRDVSASRRPFFLEAPKTAAVLTWTLLAHAEHYVAWLHA